MTNLRPAVEADAPALAAISIEVWLGTYLRRGVEAFLANHVLRTYTAEAMRAAIRDPGQIVVVSANERGPDGYVRVVPGAEPALPECRGAEIATLYVQPAHRGRGVGRALLREGIACCRARGIDAVWLTVNAENASALEFYRALAFGMIGRTVFVLGDRRYPNHVLQLDP